MAQKVNIVLVDDLDGSAATETVAFAIDGVSYEIDLSEANASRLREALAVYIGHARKASGGRGRGRRGRGDNGHSARDIREWARSQGMEVSDKGRVSAEVRQAYEKAH